MNKDYLRMASKLSNEDIALNINKELAEDNPSSKRLLALCAVLVDRVYVNYKTRLDSLDVTDIAVSLFIYVKSKRKVSISNLLVQVRKEVKIITSQFPTYSITSEKEGEEYTSKYLEGIFNVETEDIESNLIIRRVLKHLYDILPVRLKPIFAFYADTGCVIDYFMTIEEKLIFYIVLNEIGGLSVSGERTLNSIPEDPKTKALFVNELMRSNPEILSLLVLLGDVNKLILLSEILGGKEFKLPEPEELLGVINDASKSANEFSMGESVFNSSFLTNLINTFDTEDNNDDYSLTLASFYEEVLKSEVGAQNALIDDLTRRYNSGNLSAINYFNLLNIAITDTVDLISRISKSADSK